MSHLSSFISSSCLRNHVYCRVGKELRHRHRHKLLRLVPAPDAGHGGAPGTVLSPRQEVTGTAHSQ